jgi:acetylornithine/N-succinyldiaminopimelate aminotransferase
MPALIDTYAQFPLDIVSGCGSRLRDRAGREYWDFYGGHAVALLGHSHPAVVRAVAAQAAELTFYSNILALDVRTRAAERLAAMAPPGLSRVFFCNSGAEANENAMKMAMRHTGRTRIGSLVGGWHGRSLLCLAATDDPKITRPFAPLLCDAVRLRPNEIADAERIDETIAAVIVEPIQSIAGVVELGSEFLRALRRRCDRTGVLLIYDEIQTGMGRLGRPLAAGDFGVTPDLATLAKGIAGGIPMAAVLTTEAIASRIKIGDLGTTFGGGPVACAAHLAVLDVIEREDLLAHAAELGEMMRRQLGVGPVEAVLGRGCLVGLRVRGDAKAVGRRLLERGFLVGASANPQVLRLMPPINMPFDAVSELAAAIGEV